MTAFTPTMLRMAKKPKADDAAPSDDGGKKKRAGRPVMAWLDQAVGDALDRFIASQRVRPSITDVVELALAEWLASEGFPPFPPGRKRP